MVAGNKTTDRTPARTSAAAVAGLLVPVDWPICAAVTWARPVVSAARMSMITGPSFARVTCHPHGHRVLGHGGGRRGVLGLLRAGRSRPAGRRVLARRERRAVRCGLLLGCLVCVQVAEEVLLREPPGVQVLDLEVGQLRAQSFSQVVHGALGDLAQVAEGAAGPGGD